MEVGISRKYMLGFRGLRTRIKVLLENGWNSKQMITVGEAAIPLKTTLHAFRDQEKTKQRPTTIDVLLIFLNCSNCQKKSQQ